MVAFWSGFFAQEGPIEQFLTWWSDNAPLPGAARDVAFGLLAIEDDSDYEAATGHFLSAGMFLSGTRQGGGRSGTRGPSGRLSTRRYITKRWDKATFTNANNSFDYHYNKHVTAAGKGLTDVQYVQASLRALKNPPAKITKTADFCGRSAFKVESAEGTGLYTQTGKVIWFHPR
jgi:hypothetical protein